jgi:4-aminobutyrate aminotransferase-like enzyme
MKYIMSAEAEESSKAAPSAQRKPAKQPRVAGVTATDAPSTNDGLTSAQKSELCKAVAIGNSPPHAIERVKELARACGTLVRVDTAVPPCVSVFAKLQHDGCGTDALLLHFASGKEAFEAVWKLHGVAVGGSKKGRARLWARQVNGEGASVRTCQFKLTSIAQATNPYQQQQNC